MPNAPVQATAEGLPGEDAGDGGGRKSVYDLSRIMKDAWRRHRDIHARYEAWQIERGVVDGSFSACLKMAWRAAKNDAAAVAHKRKMDAVMAGPKGPTLTALVKALQSVDYASFRYRAADQRAAIQAQIDYLVSEAA